MASEADPKRDRLHEAIQGAGPEFGDGHAVLTGWALVAEWMDETGARWLSKAYAAGTPIWGAKGMWHEALHGDWPTNTDVEG